MDLYISWKENDFSEWDINIYDYEIDRSKYKNPHPWNALPIKLIFEKYNKLDNNFIVGILIGIWQLNTNKWTIRKH